jgi:hypothetical protein
MTWIVVLVINSSAAYSIRVSAKAIIVAGAIRTALLLIRTINIRPLVIRVTIDQSVCCATQPRRQHSRNCWGSLCQRNYTQQLIA